jgi:O-antigen/teichoic acid export membrane protein
VPTLYMILGNVFTLVVGLPLQIYVARILGPSGLGIYSLLEAAMMVAAGLLGLGVGAAVMRFVPQHLARGEYGEAIGLVRVSAATLCAIGGIAYLVLLTMLPWIVLLWSSLESYRREIAIMGLLIPFSILVSFFQQTLRGFNNIHAIVITSSVLQLTIKAILTIGAFAVGLRLDGYVVANVSAAFCGAALLLWSVVRELRALPRAMPTLSALRQWIDYAAANYSASLLLTVVAGLDRFIVGFLLGTSAVGILVVIRQLQMLPERFNQMLLVVGAPLFSQAHSVDDHVERQRIYHLMTDWVVRSSLPLVLFLLIFGGDWLALYGPQFAAQGTVPLSILIITQFFSLLCGPTGNLAWMSGLEWQAVRISAINSVGVVVAMVALIPLFGLIGVAAAYAIATIFQNITILLLVRRKLHVQWWERRYMEWLPQAVAPIMIAFIILVMRMPVKAVELAVSLPAMYAAAIGAIFLRGWHEDDKELFQHVRRTIRSAATSPR